MLKISLGIQVLIAVIAAIFCGLFFGPLCSVLKPIGEIFSMLLQMAVLPYICFSLMHGLGSIHPAIGKKLFKRGWFAIVVLWGTMFAVIYICSMLIPTPLFGNVTNIGGGTGPTFSEQFLSYLVPANPIYDFTNNVVPAVAVFGLVIGGAIMHLETKEPLLGVLERVNTMIEKIFTWLTLVSPISIFARISVAVGTVDFADLHRLEFYVLAIIAISLFVTLWILPALLSSLTTMRYREVLSEFRDVCMLAFATGFPTIAFPFINRAVKKIGEIHKLSGEHFHGKVQTVVPLGFSFAQIGNFLMLFFIFFISFYYRHPFDFSEKILLNILIIPMSFGATSVSISAMSFLIENLNFPTEAFSLFLQTISVTLNFQVLLSVASTFTFIILVLFAFYGFIRVKWEKLLSHFAAAFVVLIGLVFLLKPYLHLKDKYLDVYPELRISEVIKDPVPHQFFAKTDPSMEESGWAGNMNVNPLDRILRTKMLKVGCATIVVPYSYKNKYGEMAGFDTAFAFELAKDLGCELQFYNANWYDLGGELSKGYYDIIMAEVVVDEERLTRMDFTKAYCELHNVLIVPNSKREEFSDYKTIEQRPDLIIGGVGAYTRTIQRYFPLAKVMKLESYQALLDGQVDAFMWSDIPAFVWCISHPGYSLVSFKELGVNYLSYPVKTGSDEWISFLNTWLQLKKQTGFHAAQYKYWIDGERPKSNQPRWSILRDVLHWIN